MKCPTIPALAQVSVAHFVSHVFILTIPALLPLLPAALGVKFIDLGVAVSLFNITSALAQAPMGFVVDRYGPRRVLLWGIAAGTAGFLFLVVFPTYAALLIAAGIAGAANGVYHPADYAILSRTAREAVMGKSFSIHSFAGFCGSAVTPIMLTTIALFRGVPAAFGAAGLFGVLAMAVFFFSRDADKPSESAEEAGRAKGDPPKGGTGVFTLPILLLLVLYVLLNLSTASIERFSVSALIQGYGVGLPLANSALTGFLACTAIGVLCGGSLADRTGRHGYVAASAFGAAAALTAVVAAIPLPAVALVAVFSLIGFLTGIIVPSRDMLVRAAAPKGAEGKVFGIVSTGFNIGGTIGPLLCGYFLDNGLPSFVFWAAVIFMSLTVLLAWVQENAAGKATRF